MDNQTFTYQTKTPANPFKKGLLFLKIIFIILGVVILIEIIIGLKTLLSPVPTPKKPVVNVSVSQGQILLSSPKQIFLVGEIVPVNIRVSTGGHPIQGVDLVVKYDPSKLTASSSGFIKGEAYDDYPVANIDVDKGILRMSGIVSVGKPGFIGNGNFGTINFKAKSVGSSDISLIFSPGSTNDSNMIEVGSSKDVLGQVSDVKINIQ